MIRILVDHDIVGTPIPVVAIAEIIGRNRKIETAEPEAARASAFDSEHMTPTEATGKSPVLPGMMEVVVRVVLPGIVSDPFVAAGMDVRSIGMALLVAVRSSLFLGRAGLLWFLASLFWSLASLRL